ncbi:MAG: methyltransferase domain-containing protein [Cyclobacteriaceae bacterium]
MSQSAVQAHSANFMGEYRNHWWNRGFLDALASRLQLHRYSSMLDVGCGKCHWSKLLLPYLDEPATIRAVDNDKRWIALKKEHEVYFEQHQAQFDMLLTEADQLPFEDNTFDIVTCQTLLIHVAYPEQVLAEMKRVLRPGGVIICAEPNNRVQHLIRTSLSDDTPIEEVLDHVKYALIYEEGKKVLGQGDNSLGDLLPGLISQAGFEDLEVRLSDKAIAMYPPYDTKDQLATLRQWSQGDHVSATGTDEKEYFQTMGPEYLQFYETYHQKYIHKLDNLLDALEEGSYHAGGGAIMHVVSATKASKN